MLKNGSGQMWTSYAVRWKIKIAICTTKPPEGKIFSPRKCTCFGSTDEMQVDRQTETSLMCVEDRASDRQAGRQSTLLQTTFHRRPPLLFAFCTNFASKDPSASLHTPAMRIERRPSCPPGGSRIVFPRRLHNANWVPGLFPRSLAPRPPSKNCNAKKMEDIFFSSISTRVPAS